MLISSNEISPFVLFTDHISKKTEVSVVTIFILENT